MPNRTDIRQHGCGVVGRLLQIQTFEVASIQPYNGDDGSWSVGPRPGGGFNAERAPLRAC